MAELGDDDRGKGASRAGGGSPQTSSASDKTDKSAADLANGVKVVKKGQQTVIHVPTILTGLPPTSAAGSAPTMGYPGSSPSSSVPGAPPLPQASGYYGAYGQWPGYPPNPYGSAPQAASAQWGYYPGQQAVDPAMAAYYGADPYAQYYAQQTQQQQAPPPPAAGSDDVNMG